MMMSHMVPSVSHFIISTTLKSSLIIMMPRLTTQLHMVTMMLTVLMKLLPTEHMMLITVATMYQPWTRKKRSELTSQT